MLPHRIAIEMLHRVSGFVQEHLEGPGQGGFTGAGKTGEPDYNPWRKGWLAALPFGYLAAGWSGITCVD
ncbi:putative uncharacterized protein [Meiothermus ruber H328]|nr:putative uncharacterized protein [Meiothermus ruber H328]